jgi:hypothetical protein
MLKETIIVKWSHVVDLKLAHEFSINVKKESQNRVDC